MVLVVCTWIQFVSQFRQRNSARRVATTPGEGFSVVGFVGPLAPVPTLLEGACYEEPNKPTRRIGVALWRADDQKSGISLRLNSMPTGIERKIAAEPTCKQSKNSGIRNRVAQALD